MYNTYTEWKNNKQDLSHNWEEITKLNIGFNKRNKEGFTLIRLYTN